MPDPIPMFTPTVVADAWHQVTAPGGYEWWYFDADGPGDVRVVAILFHGFVFHPGYLRAYARYRRRPTRVVPPTAGDFPCAYFVVYRGTAIVAQFMTQSADFAAAADRVDVAVGPNRLTRDDAGRLHLSLAGTPWVLTGRGARTLDGQEPVGRADVYPPPAAPTVGTDVLRPHAWSGADHRWVLADPLCDVAGTVQLPDGTAIDFAGRGYHDHNYGTGPIGPGLRRWMWGRAIDADGDHVTLFHLAQPRSAPDELHLLEADAHGPREIPVEAARVAWTRRTATGLRYPATVDVGPLSLRDPQVIDASPFYLRLAYRATVRGRPATAFCEVAYPHRLRWPVLGRMIEMSIHQV